MYSTLMCLMIASHSLGAQSYSTTFGLRWGDGFGATARQKIMKRTSIEGIYFKQNPSDQIITGIILDHHMPVLTKRLNLYAGAGIGMTIPQSSEKIHNSSSSILANAGIELTLGRVNISWDIMPVIPFDQENVSLQTISGFSLRYVLIRQKKNGFLGGVLKGDHKKSRKGARKAKKKR